MQPIYRSVPKPPASLVPHFFRGLDVPLNVLPPAAAARIRSKAPPSRGEWISKELSSLTVTASPLEEARSIINNDRASKLVKLFATDQSGYELEDLKGCFVEFSKDQHGSRFLQKELEVVDSDMIQLVFDEVLPVARNLMIDVYGNYVIQKFFDFGTDEQRFLLASKLQGNVVAFSLHLYGCRVIQKGLETLPSYLQVRTHRGR